MLLFTALILRVWKKFFLQFHREQFTSLPAIFRGAFGEELLVRGYLLQTLVSGLGIYPSVGLTSIIFGVLHYQVSGWLGAITTTCAGLLLAMAVMKTKALWVAVGIHYGWNALEALLSLKRLHSRERYLVEIFIIIFFWLLLLALPVQPHPEMERLWNEYILRP